MRRVAMAPYWPQPLPPYAHDSDFLSSLALLWLVASYEVTAQPAFSRTETVRDASLHWQRCWTGRVARIFGPSYPPPPPGQSDFGTTRRYVHPNLETGTAA